MSRWDLVETLRQDLRFGARKLARSPGFTAAATLTLALGIGATTAIFAVFNAVLVRPLPYPHAGELVYIKEYLGPPFNTITFAFSTDFAAWRSQSRSFSQLAAYMYTSANLTGSGEAVRVKCGVATSSFFSLLGVRPLVGRLFLPAEDVPGAPPVAVLSHALWQRRFSSDPSVVGKGLALNGKTYTVVGVLPSTFVVSDLYRLEYDLWLPLPLGKSGTGPYPIVRVVGRLKPDVRLESARSELDWMLQSALRGRLKKSAVVSPWHDEIASKAKLSLPLFLGAVGFLLLIACVNVANLLLSRAASRRKEIAVRLAVGAGRARVVQQLLTESLLLALLGGLLGLGLARWGKDLLVALISPNLPALEPIRLDWRVLGLNLALALLTGLAFGLLPALRASGVSVNETLKEGSRGAGEFHSRSISRHLLIISETALAFVLVVGAGLLLKSFLRLRGVDMGFKTSRVLSLSLDLTPSQYPAPNDQLRFFQRVLEAIKGLQGVQLTAASTSSPFEQRLASISGIAIEAPQGRLADTFYVAVSADYFRILDVPLAKGRYFTDADTAGTPSVAIVNESFARRYWPGEICLGKRIESWMRKNDWLTIVGVVGDVRDRPEREPAPKIYLSYLQAGQPSMTLLARTAGNPELWASAIRARVAAVDDAQPLHDVATLNQLRADSFSPRRVNVLLLGAFSLLGLLLAAIGIYDLVSYSVSNATHEIGVRMALGAGRGDVLRLMVGPGVRAALMGTAAGLALAWVLTRSLRSLLFGVRPDDPATFLCVGLLLPALALVASYLPARRAAKIEPVVALRYE
jgi:putative ABC transport system permease protein